MKNPKLIKATTFSDGDGEAGICPICGSHMLTYEGMKKDTTGFIYPWVCQDCGAQGDETYEVTFAGHYNREA